MAGRLLQVSLGLLLLTSFYVAFRARSDTSVAPAFSSYGKAKGWFFVAMPVLPLDESGALALPEGVRRVIVDVGAHTQTHFLAQVAADPTLLLIALEPTPDLFLAHFQNVRHPRVVLLPVAASPKEGFASFHLSRFDQCNSLAQPAGAQYRNDIAQVAAANCVEEVRRIGVATIALRTIVGALPERVSVEMVKVDAQGFDFEVAQSLGDALPRVKELLLEVQNLTAGDARLLYRGQAPLSVIDAWMQRQGFRLARCDVNNPAIQELNCYWRNCALTRCL